MKEMTFVLDDSFVLHRPRMKQSSQPARVQGMAIPAGATPFAIKGSDGRLEVDLPRGSLDFSQATLAAGSAPVGQLFLQLHQLSGHYIEAESILASRGSSPFPFASSHRVADAMVIGLPIRLAFVPPNFCDKWDFDRGDSDHLSSVEVRCLAHSRVTGHMLYRKYKSSFSRRQNPHLLAILGHRAAGHGDAAGAEDAGQFVVAEAVAQLLGDD
jgi:hypothetical protein